MKTIVNNAKMKIKHTRMKIMKRKKMATKFGKWKADGHAVAGWADLREPNAGLAAGRRSGSIAESPRVGVGGRRGQQREKTKLNLERLAGSSGLQSPCLEGGWGRHCGGSMALGSLDWVHQTLEGEALLRMQGVLCPTRERKCKYKELVYKEKDGKWERQKGIDYSAICTLNGFQGKMLLQLLKAMEMMGVNANLFEFCIST